MFSWFKAKVLKALGNDVQALCLRIEGKRFEEIALSMGDQAQPGKASTTPRPPGWLNLGRRVQRLNLADAKPCSEAIDRQTKALNESDHVRSRRR